MMSTRKLALLMAIGLPLRSMIHPRRGGTGISDAELERLWRRLQPLGTKTMPLDEPPPRTTRFGSPLELSRVHWVRPELVVEVAFLAWTDEGLLRQVTYQGIREDKPASEVRRQAHPGAQRRLNTAPLPTCRIMLPPARSR